MVVVVMGEVSRKATSIHSMEFTPHSTTRRTEFRSLRNA